MGPRGLLIVPDEGQRESLAAAFVREFGQPAGDVAEWRLGQVTISIQIRGIAALIEHDDPASCPEDRPDAQPDSPPVPR